MLRLDSKSEQRTVESLYGQRNMMDFNALYQRGEVWKPKQKALFIDSILKGIIPNNIIVNKKVKNNGINICIDGKQRMNTIFDFMDNKFPIFLKNRVIFFSEINDDIDLSEFDKNMVGKKKRIMTDNERGEFKDTSIPFAVYKNLTYEQESEIFERIQNGSTLTSGEKVTSKIKDKECAALFSEICLSRVKNLGKLFNMNSLLRNNHADFIANFMYMIHNDDPCVPPHTKKNKFMRNLDGSSMFKSLKGKKSFPLKDKVYKLFDFFFNDRIFNHGSVSGKMKPNHVLVIMFAFQNKLKGKYDSIINSDRKCNAIIHTIRHIHSYIKESLSGKVQKKHYSLINKKVWKQYQKFLKDKKIDDLLNDPVYSSMDDSLTEEESEEESEYEEYSDDFESDEDEEDEDNEAKIKVKKID